MKHIQIRSRTLSHDHLSSTISTTLPNIEYTYMYVICKDSELVNRIFSVDHHRSFSTFELFTFDFLKTKKNLIDLNA